MGTGAEKRKKAVVILNPVAGKARAKYILFDLLKGLTDMGFDAIVHITSARGDAVSAAFFYGNDCSLMVCLGGDGTLNEVISGLLTLDKRPGLCYLPAGTTNDFATTVGISKNVSDAVRAIGGNMLREIDIGKFNDRFFTYVASFGIFTKASYSADQNVKNTIGHLAYVLEGAKEISDLGKAYHVRAVYDGGETEGDFIFGSLTNTTSIGGLFKLPNSRVSLNDGLFELMLIRAPKSLIDIQKMLDMMSRGDFDMNQIVFVGTKQADIYLEEPVSWCTDGEFAGNLGEVHIRNLNNAIRIYTTRKSGVSII